MQENEKKIRNSSRKSEDRKERFGSGLATVGKHSAFVGLQLGEVFLPNPANAPGWVVLVLRKPKFALFANDVEDLTKLELVMD